MQYAILMVAIANLFWVALLMWRVRTWNADTVEILLEGTRVLLERQDDKIQKRIQRSGPKQNHHVEEALLAGQPIRRQT